MIFTHFFVPALHNHKYLLFFNDVNGNFMSCVRFMGNCYVP